MSILDQTVRAIRPLDATVMEAARARQNTLTKPPGSLGRLEEISIQLAGITGNARPVIKEKAIIICAGDHGVAARGVSAYPREVTMQMVGNFLKGGAAINVLARHAGARVIVVDAGVAADIPPQPGLAVKKVACGTADMTQGPAMSRAQALQAIEAGIEVIEEEMVRGLNIVAAGDMGIGNTTPSSAIVAAITGRAVAEVTGRGTGIDDGQLARKVAAIEKALSINRPDPTDALDVLAKVGGFEIAAIAGVILGAAARRIPVVIDGFVSTAGALIAAGLLPLVRGYMIAAHASTEIGHAAALAYLSLTPCLDFKMRLGEGTGSALVLTLVEAACKLLNEMATFESAGVSEAL
ncbi:MAG: nicotinate-nucleotide--dimethylbenzimidazole phosphoribosyltransferase [Anaerolineales bacterium]